jgi:hypothetical protein
VPRRAGSGAGVFPSWFAQPNTRNVAAMEMAVSAIRTAYLRDWLTLFFMSLVLPVRGVSRRMFVLTACA